MKQTSKLKNYRGFQSRQCSTNFNRVPYHHPTFSQTNSNANRFKWKFILLGEGDWHYKHTYTTRTNLKVKSTFQSISQFKSSVPSARRALRRKFNRRCHMHYNDIFFHNFHSLSHSKSIYLKKIRINFLSQRISIIDHHLSWHKILVYT